MTREESREREEEVRRGRRREREGEEEGARESSLVARPSRESTGITLEVELEIVISIYMQTRIEQRGFLRETHQTYYNSTLPQLTRFLNQDR